MNDLHIRVDLPADATDREVTEARAEAFSLALNHATHDPMITIKMLVGAVGNEYQSVVWRLAHKIWKEGPAAIALARKIAENPEILVRPYNDANMAALHAMLIRAAMPRLAELEEIAMEKAKAIEP